MGKRAVIYVRTSSEQQAEKNSPIEQEADCRESAEQQGLVVVNVYRDIGRYRVKNKWVEPSGTRYDRPGLLAMLRDAADGQFDVILAWREDRLYRGMRAMLVVLEAIQQHKLTIMLARETFDPATAPLKAWLAQVELENIKERMTMGVKARLRAGKANSGQDRYGYRRNGSVIEVAPEEACWVRQIFAWFVAGMSKKQIRQKLIAANAPQKEAINRRLAKWSFGSIEGILASAETYATGIKVQRRQGDRYEISVEPLIDAKMYESFLQLRRKPAKHIFEGLKSYYLAYGLLFCSCNQRWQQRGATSHYRNEKGQWVERKSINGIYFCPQVHNELISRECPRKLNRIEVDREVWRQVCNIINNPEVLIEQVRSLVEDVKLDAGAMASDRERIEKELENIVYNRQWAITQARKGSISEDDMDGRLNELSLLEVQLKGELTSTKDEIDIQMFDEWERKVQEYLVDLQDGIQGLDIDPENPEWFETFDLRHKVVQLLTEKVIVHQDGSLTVIIRLDLIGLLRNQNTPGSGGNNGCNRWPNQEKELKKKAPRTNLGKSPYVYVRVVAF